MIRDWANSIRVMLGGKPDAKPRDDQYTEAARTIHAFKRTDAETKKRIAVIHQEMAAKHAAGGRVGSRKWTYRRWVSIVLVNAIFVLSFWFDIQLVEGALTASRVIGFHFADLNSALQVMLAFKTILINLVIGTVTVLLLWWLLGGRSFCSWVCPYHLLAEWAEMLHLRLARAGVVRDFPLDRRLRTVLYGVFAGLAFATGYTVFEAISPVGILSRALIYGPGLALIWVAGLLVYEVFFTRRAWCRYVCPIGLTYGFVGSVSPVTVTYNLEPCMHEGECRKVCMVPHVLETVKKGYARDARVDIGADCTRCGMCVDVCPTGALAFEIKGLSKLL